MKKPMAIKPALIVFLMVLLAGCSSNVGQESVFSPIYVSKDDQFTDETARQILEHNELGANLFGWQHQ